VGPQKGQKPFRNRFEATSARGYDFGMRFEWTTCAAVERHPKRVSGVWVFKRTRVPVTALFQNLEDGASVDEFLEWFPGVTRGQVQSVLEHAAASLAMHATR
jgi:uncharacterized protein (DUF433 family)